jgi:mevalonate kinase
MKLKAFEARVPGKWILAGEHAVLRGSAALVFPLKSRSLEISYVPHPSAPLHLELLGEHGDELQLLFWGVLERACEMIKVSRQHLTGAIRLTSSLPVGAGLGASAALCVAIGRWFHACELIQESEVYEFSRTLENLFHGESSGVDIAVALSGEGIRFVRNGERSKIDLNWIPKWYVSYSGKRGVTIECVGKVKSLIVQEPQKSLQIDENMKQSVALAEQALKANEEIGFPLLKQSMELALKCFQDWGLCVQTHVDWLLAEGAVAAKPTGSGGGGYVLSLWKTEPPFELQKRLIRCL